MYEDLEISDDTILLPYPGWDQKPYVVQPLVDLLDDLTASQKALVERVLEIGDIDLAYCRKCEKMLH